MDFLLECIGFPPDMDQDELVALVRDKGETVAYRGPGGEHLRLPLTAGLELRLDREVDSDTIMLLPYFAEPSRLRIAVDGLAAVEDSPFDALLSGWVAPPTPGDSDGDAPGAYRMTTWITDARRLPASLAPGHVLAISVAGFALDIAYVGPNNGGSDPGVLERRRGFNFAPLEDRGDPGGCAEVSARIKAVRHVSNALTGAPVDVLEVDAPDRALHLFVSPWQLAQDGLASPRPGYRIEGSFFFTGRLTGGLNPPSRRARKNFG